MKMFSAKSLWAGIAVYLVVQMWSAAWALVWVDVYRADGMTPLGPADPCEVFDWAEPNQVFTYQNIPVGEKLVFIVSSDQYGYWTGALITKDPYRQRGRMSCSGTGADGTTNCDLSIRPNAGSGTLMYFWADDDANSVAMFSGSDAIPGQWFAVDYEAIAAGDCVIEFDELVSFETGPGWSPLQKLHFTHVPDMNGDHIVDTYEYGVFSGKWGNIGCLQPDRCGQADINGDGMVNIADLKMLSRFWLEEAD